MIAQFLAIAGGFALLAWSADRFVQGASAVAWNLNMSPLIIGLTIVSLGTSAPEIFVSGMAAWQGNAGLSVGNTLGSNIINTSLILGVAAVIMPLSVHSSIVRRELPILLLVMGFVLLLLLDGSLDRKDGMLLLAGMGVVVSWLTWLGMQTRATPDPISEEFVGEVPTHLPMGKALMLLLLGSVLLLVSSRLLVWGAVSVAEALGVSDLVIGLTIVALGTSLPELAATIMCALRQVHDIAIGNIIGSNLYNLLAVLCLPGLLDPGPFDKMVLVRDYPVLTGITIALFLMAYGLRGPGRIDRIEGGLLVLAFVAYQTLLYFSVTMRH